MIARPTDAGFAFDSAACQDSAVQLLDELIAECEQKIG